MLNDPSYICDIKKQSLEITNKAKPENQNTELSLLGKGYGYI